MNLESSQLSNNPPISLFIEMTHECNLHCRMCHLWKTKEDPTQAISTHEKLNMIEQFKTMNPKGTVVLTGGETMKKMGDFLSISRKCTEHGLTCSANTNGTHITEPIAKKLVEAGPKYLVVSLDSIQSSTHDWMRGTKGTFDKAVNAIRTVANEKERYPSSKTGVYTNCIISEANYRELDDYIEFVKNLGADGVMFQMLSRTFGCTNKTDKAFEELFPKDKEEFKEKIMEFKQDHNNDQFIMTNSASFDYMALYVDDPDFLSTNVCASGENNIMVDTYGNTQLCFNMHQLTNGKFLGNIKEKTLQDMWASNEADNARNIMSKCRKNCGLLNCHRRN